MGWIYELIKLLKAVINTVTGSVSVSNFLIEVAKGNVPGHSIVNKFGQNPTAASTGADVWAGGGLYAFYPVTAQSMEIIGTSTEDAVGQTGALSVMIFGQDNDLNEITETVIPDGTNAVALTNTYRRIYRAVVMTAGSNETNVGALAIQIAAGGTVAAYIAADQGQTQQAIYTVPAGHTAYFLKGYVGISDDTFQGVLANFRWQMRPNNGTIGAWQTKGEMGLVNIGSSHWQYEYGAPAGPIPEKTDVRIRMYDSGSTVSCVGGFDLLLVEDGY